MNLIELPTKRLVEKALRTLVKNKMWINAQKVNGFDVFLGENYESGFVSQPVGSSMQIRLFDPKQKLIATFIL